MKRLLLFFTVFITTAGYGQLWKEYADSAAYFSKSADNNKAIGFYMKARDIINVDSFFSISHIAILDSLGKICIDAQQYKIADTSYIIAKKIKEKIFGNKSREYATGCFNLGYLYVRFLSRNKEAQLLLEESKKIRQNIDKGDDLDYASSCHYLALVYSTFGRKQEALKLYEEAKKIRERELGFFHVEVAKTLANIGTIYSSESNYLKALDYYTLAKKMFKDSLGDLDQLTLIATMNIASTYHRLSQNLKAFDLLTENQKKIESHLGKKVWLYDYNLSLLGEVNRDLGNFEDAEDLFLERKKILEETSGSETNLYAANCWNLGLLYFTIGQYKKAEGYFLQSKNIREKRIGKNNEQYTSVCSNLAETYVRLKEYEKAEQLFLEGLQIRLSTEGRTASYAIDCIKLGDYYREIRDYEKAKNILTDGKQTLENLSLNDLWQYSALCISLGVLYFNTKEYAEAKKMYLKSGKAIENSKVTDDPGQVSIYKYLAEVDWALGNFYDSYTSYTKALAIQNNQIKRIFRFTSEIEQQAYQRMISDLANSFYSFSFKKNSLRNQGLAFTLSASNRNLILSSSQQVNKLIDNLPDSGIKNKYKEWRNIKNELAAWYTQPKNKQPDNIKLLENRNDALEKDLMKFVSSFKRHEQENSIGWKNIQQSLRAGEIAIEFVEFNYSDAGRPTDSVYYIALILRKDKSEPELVPLFEKRQLDSLLIYKKTSAGQHTLSEMYTIQDSLGAGEQQTLYDVIWKPIESKLNGIKTVYFAPAGTLHKISFAALPINNKEVLSDKYQLVQLSTTSSVGDKFQTLVSVTDKIMLYGGVQYDVDSTKMKQAALPFSGTEIATRSLPEDLLREGVSDFYYLQGSEQEVIEIEKLGRQNKYNVSLSNGITATEESFKTLSGKNSPGVLHIATHGFFFPDPKNDKADDRIGGAMVFKQSDNPLLRSGLALAGANNFWKGKPVSGVEDGILTAYEVSNMYLPNTKLAVLSACETGLGDIQGSEGVYGLQRAFKMAGVENLLMSLWRVDDMASAEFMQELYKNLFAKQTIQDAFYNAQTKMKNKYRNDPYKWAAWVLIR